MSKKLLLVHLHIYYESQVDYFLKKLENLAGYSYDLYVTLIQKRDDIIQTLKAFKPDVRIQIVENRGYDVAPFINILNQVNLDDYLYVLKLHTKGTSWAKNTKMNHFIMSNSDWRRLLVDALLKDANCVRENIRLFEENLDVSMIGSAVCMCNKPRHYQKVIVRVNEVLARLGLPSVSSCRFIGGTIFMARANIFKILQHKFQISDFEETNGLVKEGLLAHAFERVFGLLALQNDGRIQGVGKETWFICKSMLNMIIRFFYQNKKTEQKHIVKILKIPVYYKNLFLFMAYTSD